MKPPFKGVFLAHLALLTVAIFYGINYFGAKLIFNQGFNSFEILGLRCLVATLFFVSFHHFQIKEKIRERKDFIRLIACAFFGVTVNQCLFLWGISETSPVNSSVLMITAPIFVFLIAWIMKMEQISARKLLGLALSCTGALFLVLSSGSDQNEEASLFGDMLIMINAASFAFYLIWVRPLVQKYNPFTVVKWIFLLGSVPNIILGLVFLNPQHFADISQEALWAIVFLILAATISGYFLNAWAMKKLPASSVGIYIYVQPIFVTFISAFFNLSNITWEKLSFILLIFAGVILVSVQNNKVRETG